MKDANDCTKRRRYEQIRYSPDHPPSSLVAQSLCKVFLVIVSHKLMKYFEYIENDIILLMNYFSCSSYDILPLI